MNPTKTPLPAPNLTGNIGGMQTSTPQTGGLNLPGLNPFNENTFMKSTISPTSTGGVSFNPSIASSFNQPVKATSQPLASKPGLSSFITNQTQTPGGSQMTTSGNGDVVGHTPNSFNIDTSGSVPSTALSGNTGTNDLNQQHNQYMDYVQGLAHAQGYSPEYIQALQAQQQAQTQGAGLQLNSAALNSNLYTGNNLPGDTMNYAQGATAKAQAQNTLAQSQNSIQQLSANQQMQVQALIRSGNISAAQSLVSASQPVGVSPGTSLVSPLNGQESYSGLGGLTGVNAVNQFNSLQSQHPDANIPPYDSSLSPAENQQLAMKAVQSSPSFQSSTPEGQANISSLVTQQGYLDTTTRSYQTATSNLGTLQTFMQQNSINQSNVPIINQITNKVKSGIVDPGAIDAFKSSLAGLRAEYAQVLSRGGTVTDTERHTADALIPDDLNPQQLATVTKQLSLEGQNAIKESQAQVNTIKGRLSGQTQGSTNGGNVFGSFFGR